MSSKEDTPSLRYILTAPENLLQLPDLYGGGSKMIKIQIPLKIFGKLKFRNQPIKNPPTKKISFWF